MSLAGSDKSIERVLEVKNLSVKLATPRETSVLVQNASFGIGHGQTLGLVGESGSGKSLSLLAIMQLLGRNPFLQVTGEAIFQSRQFGAVNLLEVPAWQINKIRGNELSMVFQDPQSALNPCMRCGEQVAEVLKLHKKLKPAAARKQVLRLFSEVKLPDPQLASRSYPHQLSGGQLQRVTIAMAIACNPSLLVADEPSTSLDVSTQAAVLELFRELGEQHRMSVIFVTHDLNVVAEVADALAVMYQGKIVEKGTLWDVFSYPRDPYTKGLLASRPRVDLRLKELPVINDFIQRKQAGNGGRRYLFSRFASVGEALLKNYGVPESAELPVDEDDRKRVLLKVENLSVGYPVSRNVFGRTSQVKEVVKDVSFEINEGEVLALVGESGCGKSTIARALARLLKPQRGHVWFNGGDVLKMNERELRLARRDMQMVFQDPWASLNPQLTIGQAIMEPMKVWRTEETTKERVERAIDLLETVNISATSFNRYPHEFSGGQRQRVCIARALALSPRLLVCDEPLSSLDVPVQAQILNLLNYLKQKYRLTLLFISHDLSVVKFFADRIAVMQQGSIVEYGSAIEIYEQPRHECTRHLMSCIPRSNLEHIRGKMLKSML